MHAIETCVAIGAKMTSSSSSSSPEPLSSPSLRTVLWPKARSFLAGYCSGIGLVLAGHPFDTIKVRLATQGSVGLAAVANSEAVTRAALSSSSAPSFSGPIDCLSQTIRNEGLLAVYKGVVPPLLATGIINSVLFGLQWYVSHEIARWNVSSSSLSSSASSVLNRRSDNTIRGVDGADDNAPVREREPNVTEVCLAAVATGLFISILVTPMERIKTRLQVQYDSAKPSSLSSASSLQSVSGGSRRSGTWQCIKDVYAANGLRHGLYKGWTATAFCRMSNYAYFGSYAFIRRALAPRDTISDNQKPSSSSTPPKLSVGRAIAAGGLAGMCYWLSCYPMDVVKNRMQASPDAQPPLYKSTRDCIRQIYTSNGLRGFFVGFTPCVLRAFPANAAAFACFEVAMHVLPETI